ncbi:MAG: glycosyltransferase [Planctomycetota bacterium]
MVDPGSAQPSRSRTRLALAHDWLIGRRGGEAVLERFARITLDDHEPADLYTLFDAGKPIFPAIDRFEKRVSWLNSIPLGSSKLRRWLLPLYPFGVRSLSETLSFHHNRRQLDLLISTSSGLIKGLEPPPGVPHLCYCHAPARYLWSLQDEYTAGGGLAATARKLGFGLFTPWLKSWDRRTASNVTRFIANSSHIASEIRRCFDREADVLHPPVRTDWFKPSDAPRRDFWLVVSALEPYKRTDLAIRAAAKARTKLVIAGTGTELASLKSLAADIAPDLVEFAGRVSDERLLELYRTARCLIFPQVEDFGIIAVEAQACGCPVVARRAGGSLDSVIENATGAFFEDPTPDAVADAASRIPENADSACRTNAERFSVERFDARAREIIAEILKN